MSNSNNFILSSIFLLISDIFILPTFFFSLLCVNKEKIEVLRTYYVYQKSKFVYKKSASGTAKKKRKSRASLEVVKDFSLRHVEGETRNISKMTHKSNVMAMFRCAQHDGKFAPQNLTTSMSIFGGISAITKLRFVHYRSAIANKPDFII